MKENDFLRCLIGREKGREIWWSPSVFSPSPPKYILPKLGRNQERKWKHKSHWRFDQKYLCNNILLSSFTIRFFFFFFFIRFLLLIYYGFSFSIYSFFSFFFHFCHFILLLLHFFNQLIKSFVFFSRLFWFFFFFFFKKCPSIHNFNENIICYFFYLIYLRDI